jgi:hypothetical protein
MAGSGRPKKCADSACVAAICAGRSPGPAQDGANGKRTSAARSSKYDVNGFTRDGVTR